MSLERLWVRSARSSVAEAHRRPAVRVVTYGIVPIQIHLPKEISRRLTGIFMQDDNGRRPVHGPDQHYIADPAHRDLALFYEHFHGDTGKGLGASHQSWTGLVAEMIQWCWCD